MISLLIRLTAISQVLVENVAASDKTMVFLTKHEKGTTFCARTSATWNQTAYNRTGGMNRLPWNFYPYYDNMGCLGSKPFDTIRYLNYDWGPCQNVTIQHTYNGWTNDDARYCGPIMMSSSFSMEGDDRAAVRHMWCYYDLNFKTFCASLGDSPSERPLEPFTCRALDKVMSFRYKGNATWNQTIHLNVGDCNNYMKQGSREEIQVSRELSTAMIV
eukprot:15349323-Ditylum_brightwellii.AAC.1